MTLDKRYWQTPDASLTLPDETNVNRQETWRNSTDIMNLEELRQAGRYEIRKKLGRGSAGIVLLAWDPLIRRQVAIKMSRPTSEKARKNFFLEAESAGKLNHPNIVAIYDTNLHEEYCYIVMEYIDGTNLSHYCTPKNLLPPWKAAEIIVIAGKALDYAHKEGVIHKDIKPSNLLIDKLGTVKITDFSIAQQIDKRAGLNRSFTAGPSKSSSKTVRDLFVIGTLSYMSPEQLSNQVVGRESDIFSLGCVLYELLTGVKAFSGNSLLEIAFKTIHQDPPPVTSLNQNLPKEFDQIIQTALAKNPSHRYFSCSDLAYEVKAVAGRMDTGATEARDYLDLVHGVAFFRVFTKEQVRELVTASNIIRVPKDRIVIHEGDSDDIFYILLSGRAKVQKGNRFVASLGPGECFGEMAHLSGQARTATVLTESNSTLLKIKASLLHKWPDSMQLLFYQRFAKTLAHRLITSQSKMT
ncbi:MAG: serine/threonine-protein kinase [Thermodesulfobacteriota bacterium]